MVRFLYSGVRGGARSHEREEEATMSGYRDHLPQLDGRPFLTKIGVDHVAGAGRIDAVGEWHHLAVSYDGTTKRLFVDGVQHATTEPLAGNFFNTFLK